MGSVGLGSECLFVGIFVVKWDFLPVCSSLILLSLENGFDQISSTFKKESSCESHVEEEHLSPRNHSRQLTAPLNASRQEAGGYFYLALL